ncbi:hypothetical protein PENTCL1PPCAC_23088 [Pristionchus entomophagus]|uniref:Uncharacterized protein n=1 Tax=Pristionchus entomophagus TaxID=358040 RepID=A0AAV5U3A8_9BILA|nr:hypothetical protein PENTCL1PPCAC_23088 [Pristionchus entomophagus]
MPRLKHRSFYHLSSGRSHNLARTILQDMFYSVLERFPSGTVVGNMLETGEIRRLVNRRSTRRRLNAWSDESAESTDDEPYETEYESLPSRVSTQRRKRRDLLVPESRATYRRFSRGASPEVTEWVEDEKEISDVSSEVIDLEHHVKEEWELRREEERRAKMEFDPARGKRLIAKFLETVGSTVRGDDRLELQRWKITDRVTYTIEFMCLVTLPGTERYKYCTKWSNGYISSYVYFNVDLNESSKGTKSLSLTYTFPNNNSIQRENSSPDEFNLFLRQFDHNCDVKHH